MSKVSKVWLSLQAMVIVGDNDLVVTDMNKHVQNAFGWTRDEVIGKNINFLLQGHPPELPEAGNPPMVLHARHKKDTYFTVIAQTMRDPMATLVGWVLTPLHLPPMFDFSFSPTLQSAVSRKLGIDDIEVRGRNVLVRVDFNVPLNKEGNITDDTRIRLTLPTLRKVIGEGGRLIIMSHLGRPKGKRVESMSLKPICHHLEGLLGKPVAFADDCLKAHAQVQKLRKGEVLLLENLRFHPAEDSKDLATRMQMAEILASYAEIFVSDAFGTAHRESASMSGVPRVIGAGVAGYLMQREVLAVSNAVANPATPVVAIVGGSKVSDKIGLLVNMFNFAQAIIIGGSMAFTFLEAMGHGTGNSKTERLVKMRGREVDLMAIAKDIMDKARQSHVKLILPIDHACSKEWGSTAPATITKTADVPDGFMALDIGPKTIEVCESVLREARTIVWNGPVGVFEQPQFGNGCERLAECIAGNTEAYSLVGGGDTAASTAKFHSKFSHVSTGGGATLELLEGKALPGLVCLSSRISASSKL